MIKGKLKTITVLLLIGVIVCFVFFFVQDRSGRLVGVYWGAFDPPTEAHVAIITQSISEIPLKKLLVVINNHPYKNYTYSLEMRLQMMKAILRQQGLEKVELLWQDDARPLDFAALKEMTQEPLCAIAGYDAYKKWVVHSTAHDRLGYDAIAVIPRGGDDPILLDKMAFLLPIDSKYRDLSSTKVRASLCRETMGNTYNESTERNISTK